MLKKTKNKIIIIFFVIGIISIAIIGFAFIRMLDNANSVITTDGLDNSGELSQIFTHLTQKPLKFLTFYLLSIYFFDYLTIFSSSYILL